MQALLALSLLSALLATGTSLECEYCSSLDGSCTGQMQTCGTGQDTCVIAVTETKAAGMTTKRIIKGCDSSSVCKDDFVDVNYGSGFTTRVKYVCCTGDSCTTASPQLPPENTKPNGMRCPACNPMVPSKCGEEINCTGSQNQCIDFGGTRPGGTSIKNVPKGCVTESLCSDLKNGKEMSAGRHGVVMKFECRAASSAFSTIPAPAGLFLPALTGLLIVKLLS